MDAYHGLFRLDLSTKAVKYMITPSTTILSPSSPSSTAVSSSSPSSTAVSSIDPVAILSPKFYNDFDITNNNKIIFTDSSYLYGRCENREEIIDGAPRGRVLMYDMFNKELSVIVCGLHFPNGVQLILNDHLSDDNDGNNNDYVDSNDSEEVIVNDLTRFRVLKINISSSYLISSQALQSCDEYGSTYQGTVVFSYFICFHQYYNIPYNLTSSFQYIHYNCSNQ